MLENLLRRLHLFAFTQVYVHHTPSQVLHAILVGQTPLGVCEEAPYLDCDGVLSLHLFGALGQARGGVPLERQEAGGPQQLIACAGQNPGAGRICRTREVEMQILQLGAQAARALPAGAVLVVVLTVVLVGEEAPGYAGRGGRLWPARKSVVVLCARGIH